MTPTVPPSVPTSTPTPSPRPTPLEVEVSPLKPGKPFIVGIELEEDITQAFDFYLLADVQYCTVYTIYLNGVVEKGIRPICEDVPGYKAPFSTLIFPKDIIPTWCKGRVITFYTVVVEAGKIPPVKSLSELTPDTPYVIMLDKLSVLII